MKLLLFFGICILVIALWVPVVELLFKYIHTQKKLGFHASATLIEYITVISTLLIVCVMVTCMINVI